jgi:uracil-DNA glycosylase
MPLGALLDEIRSCRACAADLPLGPRPDLRLSSAARLLIISQAPGRKVHETGIPWNDASGDRLRAWLRLDQATFEDGTKVAIIPIGFCYPGAEGNGGDRPPRPECAPLWHERLLKHLPNVRLTLLVGQHAQRRYLSSSRRASMTETVEAFLEYGPRFFPLPHPSWRCVIWIRKHPWFERDVLPRLREDVQRALALGAAV